MRMEEYIKIFEVCDRGFNKIATFPYKKEIDISSMLSKFRVDAGYLHLRRKSGKSLKIECWSVKIKSGLFYTFKYSGTSSVYFTKNKFENSKSLK